MTIALPDVPPLTQAMRDEAMVLAMSVRNALEGTLRGEELGELSLTDEQMALLNPIVRNALATALLQTTLIRQYWEPPELLDDYVELWETHIGPADDSVCRRCGRAVIHVGGKWTHINAEGGLNVGCRAASFTAEAGWDDKVPRTWTAAPKVK